MTIVTEYISCLITQKFEATDGTRERTIPCGELAPGCTGLLLVFDSKEAAQAYSPESDIQMIVSERGDVSE